MSEYRKKPEVFEAHQWSGSNWHQMLDFAGRDKVATDGKNLFFEGFPLEQGGWVIRDNASATVFAMTDEQFQATYEEVPESE